MIHRMCQECQEWWIEQDGYEHVCGQDETVVYPFPLDGPDMFLDDSDY